MTDPRGRWFHWRGHVAAACILPVGAAALLSPPSVLPGSWIDAASRAAGLGFLIAGLSLRFWATVYIGGRKGRAVVSSGPYSLCRNPLYIGSFLVALSAVFFFRSLTFAAGLVPATLAYTLVAVFAEERFLRDRLGEEYREYCRRVPRYIPRAGTFRTDPWFPVKVRHLGSEARRALPWIALPIVAEVVGQLRTQPWWPHPFGLP